MLLSFCITMSSVRDYVLCFFQGNSDHRDQHSFPTRRSSDLHRVGEFPLAGLHLLRVGGKRCEGEQRCGQCPKHETSLIFEPRQDRKSTRLNSSHSQISYAVFCLKKKKTCTDGSSATCCSPCSCHSALP